MASICAWCGATTATVFASQHRLAAVHPLPDGHHQRRHDGSLGGEPLQRAANSARGSCTPRRGRERNHGQRNRLLQHISYDARRQLTGLPRSRHCGGRQRE